MLTIVCRFKVSTFLDLRFEVSKAKFTVKEQILVKFGQRVKELSLVVLKSLEN